MEIKGYSVKTPAFEGPLDLLLDLIEKRKLFVSDVSLAAVTDDFIAHLEREETSGRQVPLSESAEFILIASTLMLIKSRSLLPALTLTEEEEASIDDLEERLKAYAQTKARAELLRKKYGKEIIFEKKPTKAPVVFSPSLDISLENITLALDRVFLSMPKIETVPKAVVKKVRSLEETIALLSERISKSARMSFREFAGHKGELTPEKKVMVIVGFLAMLELVKRGAIRVSQEGRGDIEIETDDIGTPVYT